jgi:cation:H+ antiporter
VFQPIAVPAIIVDFDLWVMLAANALMVAFSVTGWRLGHLEGAIFRGLYTATIASIGAAAI